VPGKGYTLLCAVVCGCARSAIPSRAQAWWISLHILQMSAFLVTVLVESQLRFVDAFAFGTGKPARQASDYILAFLHRLDQVGTVRRTILALPRSCVPHFAFSRGRDKAIWGFCCGELHHRSKNPAFTFPSDLY
jgi:hypothetical protein